jgi:MFS family permease
LVFGRLTDRFGRKRLFMVTLAIYLAATVLTALSPNFIWFVVCRFITGSGIGGEYSAVNSAIDELIPARARGWTDLVINSTWWVGTAFGASLTLVLLNPSWIPVDLGWRLAFGLGAILGLAVLLVRHYVPESPRWLMMHGRFEEAERVVSSIEEQIKKERNLSELPEASEKITIRPRGSVGFGVIARTLFKDYPKRAILGLSLMMGQAFLYNAITFTYALILASFFGVPAQLAGLYQIPFAIGNVLGPLTIGRLFDTVGRRKMISFTYITSGVLLTLTGWMFSAGLLNAVTQTICWSVIFFFASAGASSAYLTVSEVFPLEIRALAIAFFYSLGTLVGVFAPSLFGGLIGTRQPIMVFYGDLIGAVLMAGAGVIAIFFAVDAERKSLESIARPLSADTIGGEAS